MGFAEQRFNVNLSILFTELPLLERPAAAAAAGFGAVELWWPWVDSPTPGRAELDALRKAIEDAGVRLTGLNFYAGQLPGPDRGALSVPGAASERFRANIDVAAEFARSLGCTALNALYGNRVEGVRPEEQDELGAENLAIAARAAKRIGGTVLVEPVSGAPRYPLLTAADALAAIDRAGEDNLRLLLDVYHLSVNGDDVDAAIEGGRFGHVQVADAPGRHQPGTGELPIARWLDKIAATGYDGRTALEYVPEGPSADSFGWLEGKR
jgi:hydroxypyruvate isomerase